MKDVCSLAFTFDSNNVNGWKFKCNNILWFFCLFNFFTACMFITHKCENNLEMQRKRILKYDNKDFDK